MKQPGSHLKVRNTNSDGEAQGSVKDQELRGGGCQTEGNTQHPHDDLNHLKHTNP